MNDAFLDQTLDLTRAQVASARQPGLEHLKGARSAEAAARNFEAFFIARMLDQVFEGVETDGLFGGGQGEKVWRSMLNQEYGKVIAKQKGVGIADMVQAEILKIQEDANQ